LNFQGLALWQVPTRTTSGLRRKERRAFRAGLRQIWLLVPVAARLGLFAWPLTLHETAAGCTYAAYGSVNVGVALLWLWPSMASGRRRGMSRAWPLP